MVTSSAAGAANPLITSDRPWLPPPIDFAYESFPRARTRRKTRIDISARGLTNMARKCTQSGLEFNLQSALAFVRNSLYRTRRFHGLRAQAALSTLATTANSRNRECGVGGPKRGISLGGHRRAERLGHNRIAIARRRGDVRRGHATN
jgi:hypothetical protein